MALSFSPVCTAVPKLFLVVLVAIAIAPSLSPHPHHGHRPPHPPPHGHHPPPHGPPPPPHGHPPPPNGHPPPPHCHPPRIHIPPHITKKVHTAIESEIRCMCLRQRDRSCPRQDAVGVIEAVLRGEFVCPSPCVLRLSSRGRREIRNLINREGRQLCSLHHGHHHRHKPHHHPHNPPPVHHTHLPPHLLGAIRRIIECETYCFCDGHMYTYQPYTPTTSAGLHGSCDEIYRALPASVSGVYNISTPTLEQVVVYCLMGQNEFGENGGWMRIANVNRGENQTSEPCPQGFLTINESGLCVKNASRSYSSTLLTTYGVEYTKVCGRIIGLQYFSTDAFCPSFENCPPEDTPESPQRREAITSRGEGTSLIDREYVDGVSITHGQNPRQHIFTLASGLAESPPDDNFQGSLCPCSVDGPEQELPEFIGTDYYCETGAHESFQSITYFEDPLWDGQGCGEGSTCCEGKLRPWFCKEVKNPASDDVEVRIMLDSGPDDENMFLQEILLYVQ